MRVIATFFSTLTVTAAMASALPGLPNENEINEGLLAVGIADEIRKKCDSIGGRVLKAVLYMNSLEKMALDKGYTPEQIDSYVNDKAEKAKMRAKGEAYLAANGVDPKEPQTYCDLGKAEIAKESQIGSFLRAK